MPRPVLHWMTAQGPLLTTTVSTVPNLMSKKPEIRTAHLLAIVEEDKSERVQCQEPGCGHSVYQAIHVVRDGGVSDRRNQAISESA